MGVARYIMDDKGAIQEVAYQSGIKVKPVYGPKDLQRAGFSYEQDLGEPGEYPFTRSLHPQGYRSRAWTTRQYTGFGTPEQTNERFKLMIANGQNGLNVAFDLPTQMGYDSDHPLAEGEVGRVGMAVDSLKDFLTAFDGIPLDRIGSGLTINAVASIMMAMYQALGEAKGFDKTRISCTPQNDILKEMIGRGAWIFPVEHGVRLVGDTIEYAVKELPRSNPVSICGYHIRESGATPAQEIAYAFEIARAYIDTVAQRGIDPSDFVGRFSFNFNVYGNLWEQVAKFRAARKIWAQMLKRDYGVTEKKKLFLRGLFGGGGSGLTKEEPENNIMRGAFYALGAALSGAQTTALCSFDEAYTIPTPRSALLSLKTLELLMDEVGLRDTVDPLAGSYFVETLTLEMADKIKEEMAWVKEMGGIVSGISEGMIQKKVSQQAFEFEKGLQSGEYKKVGKTPGKENEGAEVELHRYNEAWAQSSKDSLAEVKRTRHEKAVADSLRSLEKAAKSKDNVMPPLVDCCKAFATVGEMADVFRQVFGEWQEPIFY